MNYEFVLYAVQVVLPFNRGEPMGSANQLRTPGPDRVQLKKIIENSLLSDWIIRIEHEHGDTNSNWLQWGDTFFAIRSAESVLDTIMDCYHRNGNCSIRMNAEKVLPRTRMLYTVCRHHTLPASTVTKPVKSTIPCIRTTKLVPLRPGLATSS